MIRFTQTYKKRVSGIISLLLAICFVSPANAENVFYCSTELETGIKKEENGKWVTGPFKQRRYTVKFNSDFTEVDGFAPDLSLTLSCHVPFPTEHLNALSCSDSYGLFLLLLNKENSRFTLYNGSGGYIVDSDSAGTESMYAGTCETF